MVEKLTDVESSMAKMTGVTLKKDSKNIVSITAIPAFKGHSPMFGSRFQKVKYDR
jgi:hypothetical protein